MSDGATPANHTNLLNVLRSTIEEVLGNPLAPLWIAGQPVPASRPRVSKFGTYYSKTYQQWLKTSWISVETFDVIPTDRPVVVLIESIFKKARTSTLTHPLPDVDNLAKGPMDQLTKLHAQHPERGAWLDDKQVVLLISSKRFAKPDEPEGILLQYAELKAD